jgi:cholesterol transport system auxiliary component
VRGAALRTASARAALVTLVALLCGCGGLLRSNAPNEQIYFLRAPTPASAGAGAAAQSGAAPAPAARDTSLRVEHPQAGPALDSARILLVQPDHRMDFYAASRWPAPLPDVLEALAVETLRGSGEWSSVQDSNSAFPAAYLLQLTVRRFEADYTAGGEAPEVHVVLDCIIGRREGRDVIATFTVAGSATASANRLSAVVAAFEQATGSALTELSRQAAQAVRSEPPHAAQNPDSPAPSISR